MRRLALALFFGTFPCSGLFPLAAAQSPTAAVNGQVRDTSGAVVQYADVQLIEDRTNVSHATKTKRDGIYAFTNIPPGNYHLQVSKAGFKTVVKPDIVLNVLDALAINFDLPVGAVSQTVTVEGGGSSVNTESAAVSTVVDRQFAENLPMNGRSFQTLIELTPGVVLTTSSSFSDGQFSINGQRADSNYWMVDGVSANIGVSSTAATDTLSGSLGGFSAQGGTNSLVSVDAMQEFRIQTSTFAPEFGRTPGGQISIVTRSGTNQFHGSAFDYFRNDVLDANDWFNGSTNVPPLPKAEERQNDFGGTLSGPLIKNRMFFFFSYEGLRLRLPQTGLTIVPDASFTPGGTTNSRQNAIPAMQPFLNAFPLPNPTSPEIYMPCDPTTDPNCPSSGLEATGSAAFNASYSNRSTLNATSLRIDHRLTDKLTLFGRYNYAPSELVQRPGMLSQLPLNDVSTTRIPMQTITVGTTALVSPALSNDFRANYSRVDSEQGIALDNFGGATPFVSSLVGLPSPYTSQNSRASLYVVTLNAILTAGNGTNIQTQRQINLVDNVALQMGTHALKLGADYRRLTPSSASVAYNQLAYFADMNAFGSGSMFLGGVIASGHVPLILQNLGLFAQDTWRVHPRLTLTYGLRWDVDFSPRTSSGSSLPAVVNFNDPATLALAPPGTPVFSTQYGNVAPRIGAAYQLRPRPGWESVLRGGWGLFYDLTTTQLQIGGNFYPFGSQTVNLTGQFPLNPNCSFDPNNCPNSGQPAPITAASPTIYALDPHLKAPYTQEWNLAFEQSLGPSQSLSATYLGAAGRRLLINESYLAPNANVSSASLTGNYGTSDYESFQLQFRRRLTQGLQVLGSYTWAHSIDTGSTGAGGLSGSDLYSGQLGANINRGPSDFDIRNSASIALTYDVPPAKARGVAGAISRGWSTENVFQARSAPPVDVDYPYAGSIGSLQFGLRPDVVPGQPFYLNASQCLSVLLVPCPGGKGFNPNAFTYPPTDPNTGLPTRQGDLGRNALRGFGAWQWDFALHREFALGEHVKLQFRSEMFNLLNHPNFAPPVGALGSQYFGYSFETLGQSLGNLNGGSGGFSPLYQFGGPRSVQLALKLTF
jgi:hypothetical protein